MPKVHEADVGAVLDELVNQFTDPMAFFRELVQNAIDAGSLEVDIRVEHEPSEDGAGLITAYIDDFGAGMTREIIEGKLTRLFSSTKDDDYTKIGRFGIGFVSVFAVNPRVVVVDTARAGESWRVIFHSDRTWDLIRLETPGEGTQIRVVMDGSEEEAGAFGERAVRVLKEWCKHVEVPIYFNGEDIREPFEVDAPFSVMFEEEGTRMVAGYSLNDDAPYGYYNRGLTLSEGLDGQWPPMTFKVDSRYLEHTLTRDRVIEDKNFHKVVRLLTKTANETLPERLVEALEEAVQRDDRARYRTLIDAFSRVHRAVDRTFMDRFRKRKIILTTSGAAISLSEVQKAAAADRLLLGGQSSHLGDFMREWTVVHPEPVKVVSPLLDRIAGRPVSSVDQVFSLPEPADMEVFASTDALVNELQLIIEAALDDVPEIEFGRFNYPGSEIAEAVAWVGDGWVPQRIGEVRPPSLQGLRAARLLILNASHTALRDVMHLAEQEPEWAALQLFKLIVVPWGLDGGLEDRVSRLAAERRLRRRSLHERG